jgi:hypothetical protein
MISGFKRYIVEAKDATEDKLTHLEHAEDHHINAGHEGIKHALTTMHGVHNALAGQKSPVHVTTKYDGAPSIVFGHHPENGKFFVGTKSVFNKTPKINHTHEDIEKNHGHAPGLAQKLHIALDHLHKVTPKGKIYQADVMHTPEDVHSKGGSYHFKPNTITYSTPHDSEHGKAIKHSKIGVAVHTEYKGKTFDGMKAHYGVSTDDMPKHKDVHVIDTHIKHDTGHYTDAQQNEYHKHVDHIMKLYNPKRSMDHHMGHETSLKTYINHTVRTGTTPSIEGYKSHLSDTHFKKMSKLKTPTTIAQHTDKHHRKLAHIDRNADYFKNTLDLHHHLQAAKNVLVNSLNNHQEFKHTIGGKASKPEGFVAVHKNRPTKLVHRHEFSAANFAQSAMNKK